MQERRVRYAVDNVALNGGFTPDWNLKAVIGEHSRPGPPCINYRCTLFQLHSAPIMRAKSPNCGLPCLSLLKDSAQNLQLVNSATFSLLYERCATLLLY